MTASTITFDSLQHKGQRTYSYHAGDSMALWDSAYSRVVAALDPRMGIRDGGGMERAVSISDAGDYFASFAAWIVANGANLDEDTARMISWAIPTPSRDSIRFALSVEHKKEGKTRYYNVQERKISASPAKQYDKRWHEIKSLHDGSVESARVIIEQSGDGSHTFCFDVWCLREAVRDIATELGQYSGMSTARFLLSGAYKALADDEMLCGAYDAGFRALYAAVGGVRSRFDVERFTETFTRQMQYSREDAEYKAQQAALTRSHDTSQNESRS